MKFCLGIAVALILALLNGACGETRADDRLSRADEVRVKKVIVREKCGSCHRLQARGLNLQGTIGPDLTHQAQRKRTASWLRSKLTNPTSIPDGELVPEYVGKRNFMPGFDHLSESELDLLVRFLRALD